MFHVKHYLYGFMLIIKIIAVALIPFSMIEEYRQIAVQTIISIDNNWDYD